MFHLGKVVSRHGKGVQVFDKGTIAGIDEFPLFIEIGKAQDLREIILLLDGTEKFG